MKRSNEVLAVIIIFRTPLLESFPPPFSFLTLYIFIFIFYLSTTSLFLHLCSSLCFHREAACLLRRRERGKSSKYLYLIYFVSITHSTNSKGYIVAYVTNLHFLLYWKLLITSFRMSEVIGLSIQGSDKSMTSPSGNCISAGSFHSSFRHLIINRWEIIVKLLCLVRGFFTLFDTTLALFQYDANDVNYSQLMSVNYLVELMLAAFLTLSHSLVIISPMRQVVVSQG